MPYIGRDLNRGNYLKLDDISSSFNSSTKTFNLKVGGSAFTPGSAFSILVSVGGVIQEPESAYQVNNSEITFANAPTAQDSFFCLALGVPIGIGVPGNGTVNGTQMAKPFNYDGYFHLDDANNRVGINSSIPTVALDVIGNIKLNGNLVTGSGGGGLKGNVYAASGISTFNDVRVTNNLTVEGTTTTLDTNLVGVDRVEVGANSNSIVGMAVTQSGTADILNLYDGSTEVFSVADGGNVTSTGDLIISSILPRITLNDTNSESDFDIKNENGSFRIRDLDNPTDRYRINSSGGTIHEFFGTANFNSHLTATTFIGNGDFVDIDVDGRADLDDVVITGVTTTTGMVDITGSSFDEGANLTLRNTTPINNDENIANINVAANDGPSGFHTGAQIKFQSGNNWSDGAAYTDIVFKHTKVNSTSLVEALKISGTATDVSSHIAIGSSSLSNQGDYYLAIKGYERSSQGATGDAVNIGIFNQSGATQATAGIDFRLGQAAISNTAAVRLLGGKQGGWTNTTSTRDGYFKISVSENSQLIDRFTIRSNGNTGIGTMLPDVPFHILSSGAGLKVQRGNEYFSVNADYGGQSHCAFELTNALSIRTGSGAQNERFRITNDGKVGIGTDDPQKLLELEQVANRKLQFSYDDNIITIKSSNNNGNPENLRFIGDDLIFHTGTSGSANETLRITDGGDVAITTRGTVEGVSKLNVEIPSRTTAFSASDGDTWHDVLIENPGSATTNAVGLCFQVTGDSYHKNAGTGIAAVKNGTASDYGADLVFITRPQSAVAAERLRITSGGQVRIANIDLSTSSKADDLIVGTTSGHTGITIFSGTGETGNIYFGDTDTAGVENRMGTITYDHSGNYMRFSTSGNDEKVRIDSNGKFGIGMSSDQQTNGLKGKLDIDASNINAAGDTDDSDDYAIVIRNPSTSDQGNGIAFTNDSGANVGGAIIHIDRGTNNIGDLAFYTAATSNTPIERLRITSTGKIKLPDNGEIQLGGSLSSGNGDLRIYHDPSASTNYITAATNGEIKISGGTSFYDYTGVTKRAHLDSNGFRIGSVSAPTLPTTGKEPMIMRNETYFTKEIHRTISDYRGVCDGTHAGYLLLVPAWAGSNTAGKKFYGTIMCDRGSTGSGNSTQFAKVHASTAYSNDKFYVEIDRHSQYICGASKVTYNGTNYLAVRFNDGGGGPHAGIHIDGIYRGTDANFLKLLRENEVTVVDKHYGALATNPSGPPICGAFVSHMQGSTFDSGVLSNGNIRYQYAPSGQSSPYDNSNGRFTARVNGLYLVTGGVLVESGSGRLEGKLEWYDGSNWQTWVNFNGTGTTYDGTTFTCMIPLKEGYIIRMGRNSGNAYNSNHSNHYFGVHLLNALRRDDVTI